MAQELPKIEVIRTGKQYYLDWRLTQIRNVDNPHDYESFNSEWDMTDVLDLLFATNQINKVEGVI